MKLSRLIKPRGPEWMGLVRYIPYPLRATKISLDLNPFGFWLKPRYSFNFGLTEMQKEQGELIWWVRWAWFQISYSRWV